MSKSKNSMKRLTQEEERWTGRKTPGEYERAYKRKYSNPNRNLSEDIGPVIQEDSNDPKSGNRWKGL